MEKCEECSMRYLFGRQGEPWCTYFDVPLNGVGDNCRLTPAAMHLVEILIANGISDEDADLVEKAIASKGRLELIDKKLYACGECKWRDYFPCSVCEKCKLLDRWEPRQDQGGE